MISTSHNQSHPAHIWNSSLYLYSACGFICLCFVWIQCYFFCEIKAKWMRLVKVSVRCVGFTNVRISHCSCVWFQTSLGGCLGLMDKRSMTLGIPLPHDAALTSCSHVDNMCCFDFCLWNLPTKQHHEQKSWLNILWPFIFLTVIYSVIYAPENTVILMKL